MKITGTIINYFFHCKRQCWLFAHRINLEDNSEDVHIGKILHEIEKEKNNHTEIKIGNIAVDRITDEYLVEIKKSDADIEAVKWQTAYYLKVLYSVGIEKKGKIEFIEKKKQSRKIIYLDYDESIQRELEIIEIKINELIKQSTPPNIINDKKCKKCAYYEYCYI